MIGIVFHRLPQGGEVNNSQVKAIKSSQIIRLVQLYKTLELIRWNKILELISLGQGKGLIKSNHD